MELIDFLPLSMFLVLGAVLFTGYPVIFVLGGLSLAFGLLGYALGLFQPVEFYNIVPRIWGGVAENLVLTAVPTFVFMGSMLERSGIANDLLFCLQVIMRRVPGGLALSVTVMGTIMAAMTGIIGASVVMMTMLALPAMIQHRYNPQLATGTIAASGTLGILIPPSILLVIMADLLSVSVGNLFVAALIPGLFLAALYFGYILTISSVKPEMAPPLEEKQGPETLLGVAIMLARGFIPPVVLILLIKIAIFDGWATPTEAGGVGAAGAWLLALVNGRCSWRVLSEVCQRTGLTVAMIFGIFMGATAFSYVFRSLGGDDIVVELVEYAGFGSWGLLMLVMGICFLLGFFLDWVEITLIV
ncbi:MAG: TRAP transporter large permease subunit, partial [Minwuiales bacterium]|nr:TRAP transporter large permease subunit [Minwuiales bacterium]